MKQKDIQGFPGKFILPPGFNILRGAQTRDIYTIDMRGNECDLHIINGQVCLISMWGVWEIFMNLPAKKVV